MKMDHKISVYLFIVIPKKKIHYRPEAPWRQDWIQVAFTG